MEEMVEPDRTIMIVSIIGLVVIWGSFFYHKFVQGGAAETTAESVAEPVATAVSPEVTDAGQKKNQKKKNQKKR